jgi:hypothetical protein
VAIQSASRKINNILQSAWLLEQMSRTGDYFKHDRGLHDGGCALVELADLRVPSADDEQRWSLHPRQSVASQIRPTAPGDDEPYPFRSLRGGDQRGRGAGTRAEHCQGEFGRLALLRKPVGRPSQPGREPGDVKPQFPRAQVSLLFLRRQQIQKQGRPADLLKDTRYFAISRTVTTAATSMGKKHDAPYFLGRHRGHGKITIQHDARCWYPNRSFDHFVAAHVTSLALSQIRAPTTHRPPAAGLD